MLGLTWQSAHDSHPGNVRSLNEDAVLADPHAGLWVVADGMGGHEAGEIASSSITSALHSLCVEGSLTERVDAIEDALLCVNDELRAYGRTHCSGNTVGSTVVTLITKGRVGVVLWAGDSRLYRIRGDSIVQVTRDHNPVADLLDSGGVSEQEALAADTNIITRAVGGQLDLHLDVAVIDIEANDMMVLCSDGLYREIDERGLLAHLQGLDVQADMDRAVTSIMQTCLAGPARDNVTLALARAVEGVA